VALFIKILVFVIVLIGFYILIRTYVRIKEIRKIGIANLIAIFCYIVTYVLYTIPAVNLPYIGYINLAFLLLSYYMLINLNIIINHNFTKNNKTFRYFHQKDKRWKNIKYGNSTIGNTGCGVAVLSMIHSVSDSDITPVRAVTWICENFTINIGTPFDAIVGYLNNIGLENTYLPRNADLTSGLKSDTLICVLVRNKLAGINKLFGYAENHFVLLYDITGDKCRVADPENYSKSIKPIKLREIYKAVSKLPGGVNAPYISVKF